MSGRGGAPGWASAGRSGGDALIRLQKHLAALGRVLLLSLPVLSGALLGLGALLAAAALTATPALFLLAGLTAFCLANYLVLLLTRRERRAGYLLVSTAAVVGVFAVMALLPMDDPRLSSVPVEGQRFWELPTGSRIAYVGLPAEGDARSPSTPVLFLHGGPGVPDMRGDARYFGRLAQDGFDVYVYDQVGRGRSARLADPRGYTLERDVADLEAIRRKIGAERVLLIGHSYGAVLAAAYAASHPERVERMVLSSPGDPSPSAAGASMLFRLSTEEKLGVYALLLPPRPMLAYALLQVNPEAAHSFVGDRELDARFDRIYNRTRPALHCEGKPPGPELHGLGFYAHYYQQSATSLPHTDFMPDLAGRGLPTLIIKGRCDYLSWSSAREYLRALPDARLVYLRGSGHNAYQDEPERYMADVRAFLRGEPLPERAYAGDRMPEDYEGPRY
jgi:proline iminopeptidase